MSKHPKLVRGLVAAALATALAAPLAANASPAPPVSAATHARPALHAPKIKGAACSSEDGVTVVVDFRNLRNASGRKMNLVRIGCAEQPVETGFDALLGAGFDVDPSQPFVCTIDSRPLDPGGCPPSFGYWSYSHGTRGDKTWDPSGGGAGDWHPPAGSLEGWSWAPYHRYPRWSVPRVNGKDLFPPQP